MNWKNRRRAVSRASGENIKRIRTETELAGKLKGEYNEDILTTIDSELPSFKC